MCNLSLGQCSWGSVFLGAIMQATNHLKDNFPRRQFPGGYCQGAIIFGVVIRDQSSRRQFSGRQFFSGDNFAWGQLLGGNNPWGGHSSSVQLPGGQLYYKLYYYISIIKLQLLFYLLHSILII